LKKVVCVADFHIGFKSANYDNIHAILDRIEEQKDDIEILVLNGDIIDLWRCQYKKIRENPIYNDAFEHLQKVTNIVSRTIFIAGNHDTLAHEIINDDLNVEYKRMFIHENICYIHGDQFSPIQIESFFALITKRFSFIGKHVNYGSAYISKRMQKRVDDFTRANFYEYVILAHNHVPHIFRNVVYCGDTTQNPSYVEVSEGCIKIKKM